MVYTRQQIKDAYKKLSPEIQDFVMSEVTTEVINEIIEEIKVPDNKREFADSEILYAMLGLQSLPETINNIQADRGVSSNDSIRLRTKLEENIFSKINSLSQSGSAEEFNLSKTQLQPPKEGLVKEESKPAINIGNSFTQAIINQAKAMRPLGQAPANLPTESKPATTPATPAPTNNPNAYSGKDPYREPIG